MTQPVRVLSGLGNIPGWWTADGDLRVAPGRIPISQYEGPGASRCDPDSETGAAIPPDPIAFWWRRECGDQLVREPLCDVA
jgi:hypothetical protein